MEFADVILHRRSVRKFTEEDIPEEKLKKILQAGLLAPTSKNRKPCELIAVKGKETLVQLSKAKNAAAGMLAECNTAIAVAANRRISDVWIEDASVALCYMSLAATDLGIGSCWCQIRSRTTDTGEDAEKAVRKILSLPEEYGTVGILALGIPFERVKPHAPEEIDFSKVRYRE